MFKAIVGLQFGDEGKGKFIDYLSQYYTHIARFNGGSNAGHTVNINGIKSSFSQIPAVLRSNKNLYICQGAMISLEILVDELSRMELSDLHNNLYIDPRCHVVLPVHVELNKASENFKGEKKQIGSVGVGIGACFEDKSNRTGIRLIDTINKETLKDKLTLLWEIRHKQISNVFQGDCTIDFNEMCDKIFELGKKIEPYFSFTNKIILNLLNQNIGVLLETAQATFLDNSFGTYPYTVAYSTLVQNCFAMIGVPIYKTQVLGVMKAYMIRVGKGPFPTELFDTKASYIRNKGCEFGTVSHRPRRCGWLDLALVMHAVKLNGVHEIAVTNIDVLGGLDQVEICVGYRLRGVEVCTDEALLHFENVEPIFKHFNGWPQLQSNYDSEEQLPDELLNYLSFIQSQVDVPIRYVSYGPERNQTIQLKAIPKTKKHKKYLENCA